MISYAEVSLVHQLLVEKFGGTPGIRDSADLQAALSRPYEKFAGDPLYPTILEQGAALLESMLLNHPFIEGNKRTAYALLRLFLLREGLDIRSTPEGKYAFVVAVATGMFKQEDAVEWLKENTGLI